MLKFVDDDEEWFEGLLSRGVLSGLGGSLELETGSGPTENLGNEALDCRGRMTGSMFAKALWVLSKAAAAKANRPLVLDLENEEELEWWCWWWLWWPMRGADGAPTEL